MEKAVPTTIFDKPPDYSRQESSMISQDDLPIERRRTKRQSIKRHVSLNYPPLGLLQVLIDDISHSGAFVRSGTIQLGLYNMTDIIQCLGNHLLPIRAEVVRVSPQGAGLKFINPDPKLIQALKTEESKLTPANDPLLE